MTRLCFLLGEASPGTASSPMEDRRDKKVGQHIDLLLSWHIKRRWMVYETTFFFLSLSSLKMYILLTKDELIVI